MHLLLKVWFFVCKWLHTLCYPYLWKQPKIITRVPPATDDLLFKSASELAGMIREKKVTSEDIVRTYINRIKEVNPLINAIVEERYDKAIAEAKSVDQYLEKTSLPQEDLEKIKPLLGVPFTMKESCSLAGSSFSVGTLARRGFKAESDGEVISYLKSSGAIPILVSNNPELCLSWETRNFITGVTNNPYDVTRTSGGSSGGEAALLGAGASLLGVGSDIAGSIRIPAHFCGVFGHKPTPRVIPIRGHYPNPRDEKAADYLVVGPMTRYAKDLRLMTKVMAGNKCSSLNLDQKVDLSKLRVYYIEDFQSPSLVPVDEEIKEVIRKSVKHLETTSKCEVAYDGKFEILADGIEFSSAMLYNIEDIPYLVKGESGNLAVELFKSILGYSNLTFNLVLFYLYQLIYRKLVFNEKHFEINAAIRNDLIKKLGHNGVLILPAFPSSACAHWEIAAQISGIVYAMVFNTLGLPATSVPCGKNSQGMPIGVQIVAAPYQDRLCFAVAEELEKKFGGWKM